MRKVKSSNFSRRNQRSGEIFANNTIKEKNISPVLPTQLTLLIFQLSFMAYNHSSAQGGNYASYYRSVTNDQINKMKTSIDGYLMGLEKCPFEDILVRIVQQISTNHRFVNDKRAFVANLHLENGLEQQMSLDKMLELIGDVQFQVFQVSGDGSAFYIKYAHFLLEETKEAYAALKLIVAYDSLLTKRHHDLIILPTRREHIKSIVSNAEKFVNANYNQYEQYKNEPLPYIDFLEGVKDVYGIVGDEDPRSCEDVSWYGISPKKKKVLCELYRLYNGEAMNFLQIIIENGYSESISSAYRDDFDCNFPEEEEMMRNYYLEYCIRNNIAQSKICLALINSNFTLKTMNNNGRDKMCDDKTLKILFTLFNEHCQFCNDKYLKYMFLSEGKGNAFRAIRWIGSIAFLRYTVLELNEVIFGGRRLDNGGWEAICHNFVDAEDKPIPGTIKTASVRKLTTEMINFTTGLVEAGIKKAVPES